MASIWQWLLRPERKLARVYEARKNLRELRNLRENIRQYTDDVLSGRVDPRKQKPNIPKIVRTKLPVISTSAEAARWYTWLTGDAKSPEEAARTGQGFIGGYANAINSVAGSITIEPHPSFYREFERFKNLSKSTFAEALVKRASNILKIMSVDMKSDTQFIQTISQAQVKSASMYLRQSRAASKIKMNKRFGQLLLEWAHGEGWGKAKGGYYQPMAKRILPKPTPKLLKTKGFEHSTTRFIGMFVNHQKRMRKALYWYRGTLAGAMRGLIDSAQTGSGGVKVDWHSKAMLQVNRLWRGRIRGHKSTAALDSGSGRLYGTEWNPKIQLKIKGTLPVKVFPIMFMNASKKDAEDMSVYIARKLNRGR